jgi:hypothetical protein
VEVEDGRAHHAQVKPASDQVNQLLLLLLLYRLLLLVVAVVVAVL